MFLSYLGQDLNEVECPIACFLFSVVAQSLEPCLKLIENEHSRLIRKHLHHEVVAGNICLFISHARPLGFIPLPFRMVLEENIPKVFLTLKM